MQTIEGDLKPDGTIELDRKPELPPGRVRVTVEAVPTNVSGEGFFERMRKIWDAQTAAGAVPSTEAEVEAERRAARQEAETRARELEASHEESPSGGTAR